jgi:DNA mismatch endonuclease (patch repair protein)
MADVVSAKVRSRMMAGIKGKNTKPEMVLRRGLHGLGFRFALHKRDLPGRPDLVFPKHRAVLFAHGCFWHGHDCHLFKWPQSRRRFWATKILGNRELDARQVEALRSAGWRVGIVWECAIKFKGPDQIGKVVESCAKWLESSKASIVIRDKPRLRNKRNGR